MKGNEEHEALPARFGVGFRQDGRSGKRGEEFGNDGQLGDNSGIITGNLIPIKIVPEWVGMMGENSLNLPIKPVGSEPGRGGMNSRIYRGFPAASQLGSAFCNFGNAIKDQIPVFCTSRIPGFFQKEDSFDLLRW